MSARKRDLELICKLQWKRGYQNGGEKYNIIGVYDVPTTTLSWDIFKCYLLKNSGSPVDDVNNVKVTFFPSNDKEFPIKSQTDFQVALYAFRKKARNGEVINLQLERATDKDQSTRKFSSIDVQTQYTTEPAGCCSSPCSNSEDPPLWFTQYMAEFKKDILQEVSTTVSKMISNMKPHLVNPIAYRKWKMDTNRQMYKGGSSKVSERQKDRVKSFNQDRPKVRKYEEIIDSADLNFRDMNIVMPKKDDDMNEEYDFMNGAPILEQTRVIPHMIGGEVYLHTWDVVNNGMATWTKETELRCTWGSVNFKPVEDVVFCPPLEPGQKGKISVLMHIPIGAGLYESFWHFYHRGRKFGRWLGCQVIVDEIISPYNKLTYDYGSKGFAEAYFENRKAEESNLYPMSALECFDLSLLPEYEGQREKMVIPKQCICPRKLDAAGKEFVFVDLPQNEPKPLKISKDQVEEVIVNASPSKIQVVENIPDDEKTNVDSTQTAQDNKSQPDLGSESDEDNNNNEDGLDDDSSSESIRKIDEDATSNSTLNDIVMLNFEHDDDQDTSSSDYAYVLVGGTKVPVPKKYLRSDYLETAEDAPDPNEFVKLYAEDQPSSITTVENKEQSIEGQAPKEDEKNEEPVKEPAKEVVETVKESKEVATEVAAPKMNPGKLSTLAEVSMNNSTRMFMFPEDCPGFEVISHMSDVLEACPVQDRSLPFRYSSTSEPVFTSAPSSRQTTENASSVFAFVPNYQQTPPESRKPQQVDPVEASSSVNTNYSAPRSNGNEAPTVCAGIKEEAREQQDDRVPIASVVSGAMTMASTALNTAKNVVNMIIPTRNEELGLWDNGHWVSARPDTPRESNLQILAEMGFWDRDLNATLLARYNDDIAQVVAELIQ